MTPANVEYSALENLEPPMTRATLLELIGSVVTTNDPSSIQAGMQNVLSTIHEQAVFLPLLGQRIPYVVNRRLSNFQSSPQAYTYPLSSVVVNSGSTTVTVAPGSGTLFRTAGSLNPHQYTPNQMFVNDWIYEGLVRYGLDGQILPALAKSWVAEDLPSGGQRFAFQLRENVLFHDGSEWNCSVAKLNLDHVLTEPVRQRHLWFAAPLVLDSWSCDDESGDLILETSEPYYPFIQELTYVRPLCLRPLPALPTASIRIPYYKILVFLENSERGGSLSKILSLAPVSHFLPALVHSSLSIARLPIPSLVAASTRL